MRAFKNASLRTQLVTIISLLMVVVIGFTGFVTIALLRGSLVARVESDIQNNSERLAGVLQPLGSTTDPARRFQLVDNYYYAALLDAQGQVVDSTPSSLGDSPNIPDSLNSESVRAKAGQAFTLPGVQKGSDGWRTIAYPLANSGGSSVIISYNLRGVNETVDRAALFIFLTGVAAIVMASAIAYLAVSRAFGPLRRVERTAAQIAAGDLSKRVHVANPVTEIGRLSRSLNVMLSHIETAFAARGESEKKMRRFVADASHELRTPLVTIRGYSELYRHGALDSSEKVSEAMGRIESEAQRMGALVEDLLTLARIDEQRPMEAKPVDLLLLGHDAALDASASAPDRKIKVVGLESPVPSSATTVGDEARIRQVIANLLTNALRYTPEGTPIEIAVGVEEAVQSHPEAIMEIRDHGPGINADDTKKVFERFYRADTSRFRETGGTGLGLAIVAALVAQHDGSVQLRDTDGGGATFAVRFPAQVGPGE